ncbi:DrmB family protein [Streptomyces sp. NPDC056333]|uniref:DrmB family protein n=1 Tax=Streptomyces sp. NPDC056333 TaxID=3345786 RepID=UPI0035E1A8EC
MPCHDYISLRQGRSSAVIEGNVRRAQFVAPFGPGAMQVLSDGTSVITAGLDHWFTQTSGNPIDVESFRVHEWRLEKHLGVNALFLPPDYRRRSPHRNDQTNTGMSVPVLRFPAWSFCPKCRELTRQPLHTFDRPRCSSCISAARPKGRFLAQVPFVCMCDKGHMQDFPWLEWVHSSVDPQCPRSKLELKTSGGGTLASQRVTCKGCGKNRSLAGITSTRREADGEGESTALTQELEPGTEFACRGAAPWLGIDESGKPCGAPLRATLRGASNVYYALVASSIFVPSAETGNADPEIMEMLQKGPIASALMTLHSLFGEDTNFTAVQLRRAAKSNSKLLDEFDNAQIETALATVRINRAGHTSNPAPDTSEQAPFRRDEYTTIRETIDSPDLVVREADSAHESALTALIPRIRLVEKLRETRALWGFNRIFAESNTDKAKRAALLRRADLPQEDSWLPAYSVMGEGIYLEFDAEQLTKWENEGKAAQRLLPVSRKFSDIAAKRHLAPRDVTPRFTLLHTLAHLLINQLTYECGYSSASLRERLYVSPGETGMAGLLIYTAAGDSEGTLGGLVRMGQPGRFETVLKGAIAAARWCSSDPVCIDSRGQGPDSCNLAACHSCGLLPETACEEFNRFLDRGLVIGTLTDPDLGFFSQFS